MISHIHKCIFVHIPRSGGSSIEDLLWPGSRTAADLWMGFVSEFHNKHQTGGLQHLFARQVEQEVGSAVFREYFKFSFVRNPLDRLVSQYHYMQRREDLRRYIGMQPDDSFKQYLALIWRTPHVQWEPQHKFILDGSGQPLVDFIGRFENFTKDVGLVLSRLGLSGKAEIPRANATSHSPYLDYYDAESQAIVRSMHAKDFDRFGYA